MATTTSITKIESEFDNVYRITSENGLILDIFEPIKLALPLKIEYSISERVPAKIDNTYTIMNGIIFGKTGNFLNVSFGGFLGSIPDTTNPYAMTHSIGRSITIIYKLKN